MEYFPPALERLTEQFAPLPGGKADVFRGKPRIVRAGFLQGGLPAGVVFAPAEHFPQSAEGFEGFFSFFVWAGHGKG